MSTSITYIIPLAPVTKKNSQRILFNKNTGRPFVMPSKAYKDYEAAALRHLRPLPPKPIDYEVNIRCLFCMPTRRKTDLTNLLEAIDDILVKAGVLADDNYRIVGGHDGSRCVVTKGQPGTIIQIIPMEEWLEELDGGDQA